jgi:hypothetical protein
VKEATISAPVQYDEAVLELALKKAVSRRRAWLAVLPPLALGVVFLAVASHRLVSAEKEVDQLQGEADRLRQEARRHAAELEPLRREVKARGAEIGRLETDVRTLQGKLRESTDLSRFLHPIDMTDVKAIASRHHRVAPILQMIFRLRDAGVGWRLGGTSESVGFDSPSFAAHVLRTFGAATEPATGGDIIARSGSLRQALEPVTDPQPGDVVFYPAGHVLFWFLDHRQRPFVIGMTPVGIVALDPDFARRIAIGRPPYR